MTVIRQDVYKLLDEHCNAEQISALLREYKSAAPSEIRVTGKKEDLLQTLRDAVNRLLIEEHRVLSLLQRSEENGNQHIFFFRPKDRAVGGRLDNASEIAESLLGAGWDESGEYPRLDLVPESTTWSDFRIYSGSSRISWTAKAYGHEKSWRFVNEAPGEGDRVIRIFEPHFARTVSLVKWTSPNLLEIRVPRSTSRKQIQARVSQIWAMLANAIEPTDLLPIDFGQARIKLVAERAENSPYYRISDTEFQDDEFGTAKFRPQTENEVLSDQMSTAVGIFCDGNASCRHLRIVWQPIESLFDQDLAVLTGGREMNEIIIPARTTPEAVEYVANQLLRFNS